MNAKAHTQLPKNQAREIMKTILLSFLFAITGSALYAQAVAVPMPFVKSTFLDQNGKPCNGCLVWTYVAGTTTLQSSYTTSIGNVPNLNPVVLNASGQADIFLGNASYKIVFETAPLPAQSHGTTLWVEDNIPGSASSSLTQYTAPYTNAVSRTINSKLADVVSALDFGADPTGATDSAVKLQSALASGHPVYLPCGIYFTTEAVFLNTPRAGFIGESEACVTWNFIGTGWPIVWRMDPFVALPAGIVANITINGTSTATGGILAGDLVGGTFANLSINGFTGATIGAGIEISNDAGETFENNTFQNVQLGYNAKNNYGVYVIGADSTSIVSGNNFGLLELSISTGQVGLSVQSGNFSHNSIYAVCNMDNSAAGTVGPICVDSNSNWNANVTNILGKFQNTGSGTGTPYAVQVESGAKFANIGGQVNVFDATTGQLGVNNLAGATAIPSVTMHQPSRPDWDTGTFTLGSLGALNMWTGFRDNGPGSCGLLEGTNAGSVLCTILNFSGNQFIIGGVNAGSALGTATPLFSVDVAGSAVAQGNVTATVGLIGNSATVAGQTHTGTLLVDGLATINSGIAVTGNGNVSGSMHIGGPFSQSSTAPNDNFGSLHFASSLTTNTYTMGGTYSDVYCVVTPVIANSLGSISIIKNLVAGHWQISAQAAGTQTADVNYYCGLVQ